MRTWTPERVAQAAGARILVPPPTAKGPECATIDSRTAGPGSLFVGLPGASADGGAFAPQALAAGAWGVLTRPEHADAASRGRAGVVLAAEDPLRALQGLATAWRRELSATVIGVTGSTGKTSTKDLLRALLVPHRRTVASRSNFNTEIGLPLEILSAPMGTEMLVLEMAMRGSGQIAELAEVAEPDIGVIVSVGPVHLELLGTVEAVAAAKAELIARLPPGATAVIPAGERLLDRHRRDDLDTVTFGEGGEVTLRSADGELVRIDHCGELIELEVPFTQAHMRTNLLAAVAAARAAGAMPSGRVELVLSPGRGQRLVLPGGLIVIDDCYNANPMSMRAALNDLAATAEPDEARTVAILGDMLELGPEERRYHAEIGRHAGDVGVDVLIAVGPLAQEMAADFPRDVHMVQDAAAAAALAPELLESGDVILIKASRGVGLEVVCQALSAGAAS
jgi:UDP-N-acetylmuramoyl-tripeptide--D-alanyl-D-alanine ligase